ncbi:protein kinase-like domain, concanavalin A-like lectin/glucanase domain protein [Tanacetum coccineum]
MPEKRLAHLRELFLLLVAHDQAWPHLASRMRRGVRERGDGVACFKRHRRDLSSDGIENLTTASGRSRLKPALEDSTWRRNANPSSSTPNSEFLDPKKKLEIESWLEDSKIVDPLVRARIRTRDLNNIKISCMIGHFLKRQAYINLESSINVMSKQHYKWIMSKGLESRQKPSNLSKNNNFVGRVRGLKVFVGNFMYQCNFMILEDTTSIIDHHLGEVVFGKPFVKETGLVYNQEEGTVAFKKDNKKITFKMPHKMEMFNHRDFKDAYTNSIPPFVLENNDNHGKTYYSDSLILGPEYKEDKSISKEIRHLMKLEREAWKSKGEVT